MYCKIYLYKYTFSHSLCSPIKISLNNTKYPVALIDMLNDRMRCNNPSPKAGLTMTLILKPSRVRLHLVDFHRELFYDRIDQYDVFVYTEVSLLQIIQLICEAIIHEDY